MLVGALPSRPCCAACAGHSEPSGSSLLSAVALRDPHALKMSGLEGGTTMGRLGVFAGDVDALKRSIHPAMLATDGAVAACTNVTAQERAAWTSFFEAWKGFHDEPTPMIVGVGRRYDEAIAYREQLAGWQEQLRPKCSIPGPIQRSEETDASNISSAVKWGAAALIAVAVVYGVRTVLP